MKFLAAIPLILFFIAPSYAGDNIPEGLSYINQGKQELLVVKAWRDNFNAHGFYMISIYKKDKSGRLYIIPLENDTKEEASLINQIQTSHGADCTTRDVFIKSSKIVIAEKQFAMPVCSRAPVIFSVYSLEENTESMPGTPKWYLKRTQKEQSKSTYKDVHEAFLAEFQ